MPAIKVTAEQLHELSGTVASGSSSIQQQLGSLANAISPLATDWQGAASGQFQNLWQEWQKSAKGLQEALDGISKLLEGASQAYAQAEESVKHSMG